MSSITAESTIRSLREIFARFGLPEHVVTDNGPTFISTEFESFLQRNGIRHLTSAPYHPATNGLAERGVQIMKAGLKKMKEGNLFTKLSRFLLSYRITPQSTTGVAPAELLMGRRQNCSRLYQARPGQEGREGARATEEVARPTLEASSVQHQ